MPNSLQPTSTLLAATLITILATTRMTFASPTIQTKFPNLHHLRRKRLVRKQSHRLISQLSFLNSSPLPGLDLKPLVRRGGLNGDICDEYGIQFCVPPRICMDPNTSPLDSCSTTSKTCICRQIEDSAMHCDCGTPCPIGERCMQTDRGQNMCLSRLAADEAGNDEITCATPLPSDPGGFSYDRCRDDTDCAVGRSCIRYNGQGDELPCNRRKDCICYPDDEDEAQCSCKYSKCVQGEQCTTEDGILCVSLSLNELPIVCPNVTAPAPTSQSGRKYSDEECKTSDECAGERICEFYDEDSTTYRECDGDDDCVCAPREYEDELCSCLNPECLPGDVCGFNRKDDLYCVSEDIHMPLNCSLTPEDYKTPIISPFPSPSQKKGNFSYDMCEIDDDCTGLRSCYDEYGVRCRPGRRCYCMADESARKKCSCRNRECLPGDVCGFNPEYASCTSINLKPHPITCDPNQREVIYTTPRPLPPSPSPGNAQIAQSPVVNSAVDENNACIDAAALSHLHSTELVYERHVVARVLCDGRGSCATAGHIVRYRGEGMMMKKYCEIVKCEGSVMEVNSPRLRRGMRVRSRTEGLEYTGFAARFETKIEEAILVAAVRVGL